MTDLKIKNSLIIDGSGKKPYFSDISIKGERIHNIEKIIGEKATKVLDAKGLVACPGFIDPHSHTDLTVLLYPNSERAIRQGITTEVTGNCGLSSAPLSNRNRNYWKKYMNFIGQNETTKFNANWKKFSDFSKKVSSIRIGTNIACLIGHNTLRSSIMGIEGEGGERPEPTECELKEMKKSLTQSYIQGVFGLSTGLGYPVGRNSRTSEIIELCEITSKNNAVYASHIRSTVDLSGYKEFYKIIEKTNVKGIISHVRGRTKAYPLTSVNNSFQEVNKIQKLFHDFRNKGYEIYMDVIPFPSGLNSLASILFGGWGLSDTKTIFDHQGKLISMDKLFENLSDPHKRQTIKEKIQKNPYISLSKEKDTRFIHYSNNNEQFTGKTVKEISKLLRKNELDTVIEILLSSNGDTRWGNTCIEEDLEKLYLESDAIPCSDGYSLPISSTTRTIGGIPGPRVFGAFPYFIEKYKAILPIEEIIHRLTHKPAQIFNIEKRGLLKPGYFADILLFDPQKIKNNATYSDTNKLPEGIHTVIQNGKISLKKNQMISIEGKLLTHELK